MSSYNPVHFRSHVERALQLCWGTIEVEPDADGDYVFERGTAGCFVRVDDHAEAVRIIGIAAVGVRQSLAVLKEINDVNVRASTANCFLADSNLIVAQTLLADGCTPATLGQACEAVATIANDIGDMVARVHGGSTVVASAEVSDAAGQE